MLTLEGSAILPLKYGGQRNGQSKLSPSQQVSRLVQQATTLEPLRESKTLTQEPVLAIHFCHSFNLRDFPLNKTELIAAIAAETDLSKSDVSRALDSVLENLTQSLARGESVQLIGFGAFGVSSRAERAGRNPATGEAMTIKASKVPKFTPGKALKDRVNAGS